ncbi:acyltransferase family protein [Microbacterium sp. A82]|uniref:acyltransferase family protein n=1 Tax=Microbacterium sp. A82 TaxID=3450452 RepID=UPI003F30C1CB
MTQITADTTAHSPRASVFPLVAGRGVRIDAIDGLRAIAVAGVIAFHFGLGPNGGFLGVDLFFVISGFVITRALIREHDATGRISLSQFWKRRFRRIFPLLALILIAVAIWSWTLEVSASFRHAVFEGTLATLISAANWWQIFGSSGYWSLTSDRDPLSHLWSLGVEEQFYLIFPLLFVLLVRFIAPALRLRVMLTAAIAAYLWTAVFATTSLASVGVDRIYLGTDTRSGALLSGCALALFLARREQRASMLLTPKTRKQTRQYARIVSAFSFAAVVVLIALWTASDVTNPLFFTVELPLSGLLATTLIGCLVLAPASPLARLFALRPLALLGRWSYALYLWHWLVWVFLQQTPLRGTGFVVPVALVATLALSGASHYLVERPILRRSWSWRVIVISVAVVSAVLAVSATIALVTTPLPEPGTGDVVVSTH